MNLYGKNNKNCIVYNDEIEQDAISQIISILDGKAFKDVPVRIMPDVHLGADIVIGFTAPLTNMVNPSHVGVDIGCSISMCVVNRAITNEDIPLIEHRIKKDIPMGFDLHKNRVFEMKEFIKFMNNEYNKARSTWPEVVNSVTISEDYISKMLKRIGMDEGVFYKSLGTLGNGNHFIEIGSLSGNYTFAVHCGSRNFGLKVCKYWENIAKNPSLDKDLFKARVKELKNTVKDKTQIPQMIEDIKNQMLDNSTPNGYLMGVDMSDYISDMVIAQAYAKFNHHIIIKRIEDIFRKINGGVVIDTIQSIHNYIDMNDHIIRKGAIRSYENERMLVPFNMRDGIAICVGKSNPEWNCSCSHGAGRKLSRSQAKKTISMEDYKESMNGIYSTSINHSTLDESPMAYKDTDTIMHLISDTCEIIEVVKPIINIKAGESDN